MSQKSLASIPTRHSKLNVPHAGPRNVSSKLSLSRHPCYRRDYAGQATVAQDEGRAHPVSIPSTCSQGAKQKQADKEFFADLLSSAATKRDAKAYLSRLKTAVTVAPTLVTSTDHTASSLSSAKPRSMPNSLFGRARAVDTSPVFSQSKDVEQMPYQELGTTHTALVKIAQLDQVDNEALLGIAQTLAQLSRLSMAPIVVIDTAPADGLREWRGGAVKQAERLATAIDRVHDAGARRVDDILTVSIDEQVSLSLPNLLFRPLRRGSMPIVLPVAYSEASQQVTPISADAATLALAKGLTATETEQDTADHITRSNDRYHMCLDRIIVIDPSGPIPSTKSADQKHVFVNMEQEYHSLQEELRSSTHPKVSPRHASNLRMLRRALQILPTTASGLITTPREAANSSQVAQVDAGSGVGTRRHKNPLIHNLLTDKPAYSSSLPSRRLGLSPDSSFGSTFVKNGMPLTILPNPAAQEWTAGKQPWIKLTDARIDLDRLVYLINDSFDRKLDVDGYLKRVNDRMAGVIIVGEYEGGAILTWEAPPGVDENNTSRLVPYLDKFAVLKTSQGAGGVADILFNAMVRTCFPKGVCWRSRKNNPVNKWYFERSTGTWKIPDMNWTMFWTTPGVVEDDQTFLDYEAVCRSVQPTWADDKKVED